MTRETVAEIFPKRTPVLLEENYAPDLPLILCDADKMKRALSELIENAVSFMPNGGTLKVSTQLVAAGQGPKGVRLAQGKAYIRLTFSDSGPGVPPELKEKIFTPFYTSRVKGMGLGLSIVKGIVDAHHGVLRETGEPGSGANFELYLSTK